MNFPDPETWCEATVRMDSEKSPCYAVNLKAVAEQLGLPRFIHGDQVTVAIHCTGAFYLLTGRASRPTTMYCKRQEMEAMNLRPPDDFRCHIVSINGRPPEGQGGEPITSTVPPETPPETAESETATPLDEQPSDVPLENIDMDESEEGGDAR